MLAALKSDFENYRRRTNAQAENSEKEGRLFVIKKLLPVLDTFDRAREMLDEVTMTTFNLIVRQFDKVLADCGVEVIDVLGQPFDPRHRKRGAQSGNGQGRGKKRRAGSLCKRLPLRRQGFEIRAGLRRSLKTAINQ